MLSPIVSCAPVRVLLGELVTVIAVRLARVFRGRTLATQHVHQRCDSVEMEVVRAERRTAQMVDLLIIRNRSVDRLEDETMCVLRPSLPSNAAVTVAGSSSPDHARVDSRNTARPDLECSTKIVRRLKTTCRVSLPLPCARSTSFLRGAVTRVVFTSSHLVLQPCRALRASASLR